MCFGVSRQRSLTIFLQFVGLVLDVAIIIISWNLVKTVKDDKRRVGLLAQVVISSQAMIAVCSILLTLFGKHSFAENFKNSSSLGWGSILDGFALALFLWNFSYLAKDLRPVAIVHLATFICAFAPLLFHSLSERKPFPPQTQGRRISGLILMVTSFLVFIIVYKAAEVAAGTANILRRINLLWYVLLVGGAIFGALAIALRRPTVGKSDHVEAPLIVRIDSSRLTQRRLPSSKAHALSSKCTFITLVKASTRQRFSPGCGSRIRNTLLPSPTS